MSQGASLDFAAHAAHDAWHAWTELCAQAGSPEAATLHTRLTSAGIETVIQLRGLSRFPGMATLLHAQADEASEIHFHEVGIDGWHLTLRRHPDHATDADTIEAAPAKETAPAGAVTGEYVIDLFRPDDAAGVGRCFLAIYGHSYVHPDVFSPARLIDENARGEIISVVARDAHGDVVGHLSLRRGPSDIVAESGEAVVLPEHRRHGLLERMKAHLLELAPTRGIHGVYAEPLTVHTITQKQDADDNMTVCTAMLGVNPERFHPKNMPFPTAGQRQSYLRTYRHLVAPQPRAVAAPARYRDILSAIYQGLQIPVAFDDAAAPQVERSRIRVHMNARKFGSIAFDEIGTQAPLELGRSLNDMLSFGAKTFHVSCPIDAPGLQVLVDAARENEFFFCGIGPNFAGRTDTLILQMLTEPLDTAKLQLFTDLTKDLIAFIDQDRGGKT
jgi:GNAT superfamily N-acetyltransferase